MKVARAVALLAVAAGLFGCTASSTSDREPGGGSPRPPPRSAPDTQPGAPAPKEDRVVDVNTSDDLVKLNSEYMRLCDSGFEGPLEIALGPGPLAATGWSLEPSSPTVASRIDVVIRGQGAVLPLPGRIRARSVRIEGVVVTGARSGPTEIRVATEFTMRRSMMVDARFNDPHFTGGYIEVFADGGKRAATQVTIEDSWFVRNYQADDPMQMLSFLQRGEDAGYFDRVRVLRSAFVANAFAVDLSVQFASSVAVEDSLFYRNWPSGAELHCGSCGAVTVERSIFAVETVDQVATVDASPPVLVRSSHILAKGGKGSGAPAALSAAPGQIGHRSGAGDAAVTEILAQLTAQPPTLPSPEVWSRLQAALSAAR